MIRGSKNLGLMALPCLISILLMSTRGYGDPPEVPCPNPEVNPPPTTAPPYLFPLQVYGRWTAIPQCYNLWPPEPSNPCADSLNDLFPRGLYSVHAVLTHEGKVALWKQTYGLSATSEYVPRMFFADPNNFASFSMQPITAV